MKIGFLGPSASYSHQVAQRIFPNEEKLPFDSISSVIFAVEKGIISYAIAPIENSTGGSISTTLDELVEKKVFITGEFFLKIEHSFLSNSKKENIKKIYSHSQGLIQCKKWIEKNYPLAELVEVFSTSKAAELASSEKDSGAIASEFAGEKFSVKIIQKNISDSDSNETRFVIISNKPQDPKKKKKTSIIFGVKDEPGALFDSIEAFKKFGINMTKIESRPSKKKNWEYLFFVDIEGNSAQENVAGALNELQKHSKDFKNLGSYSEVK